MWTSAAYLGSLEWQLYSFSFYHFSSFWYLNNLNVFKISIYKHKKNCICEFLRSLNMEFIDFLKQKENSLTTPLKDYWNFLKTLLTLFKKLAWSILDNSLKHPLDFLETPFQLFRLKKNSFMMNERRDLMTTSLLELLIAAQNLFLLNISSNWPKVSFAY